MKNTIQIATVILALFLLHACTYDKAMLIKPDTVQDTVKISYVKDIHPIIVKYCYGTGSQTCHVTPSNQGANGDYTTYAGLKAKVNNGSLVSRVLKPNGGMPPTYSSGPQVLTATELADIQSWINEGAPNN